MVKRLIPVLLLATIILSGCTPIERTAYNTVVGAKAFLDSERKQHPECSPTPPQSSNDGVWNGSKACPAIWKAVAAKDALIDAITVYCSGPDFNTGGACNPPAKGTPAATQATAKLKAAIDNYNQIAADLKGLK